MKLTLPLIAQVITTLAQSLSDNPSQSFRLVLKSSNSTLNGTLLQTCHEGAAINSLCPSNLTSLSPPTNPTTFYYNTTSTSPSNNDSSSTTGYVYWTFTTGDLLVPCALHLLGPVTTNIQIPIFSPGNTTYTALSFDTCGALYMPMYLDDTVMPPAALSPPRKVKNWYVCTTQYAYLYQTLAWKVGVASEPQNPSCQSVEVVREWI